MSWLLLALGAYFFNAVATTVDSILLREELRAKRVAEKIAGLVLVAFGLALLAFDKP